MSAPDNSITHTIRRAIAGDTDAIAALYERYSGAIYRYIAYRVPTENDAEDLTAEVFLKMVEGLPNYRLTGAPFEAWLYRIAAARVADFHRRNKRVEPIQLEDTVAARDPLPEEVLLGVQEIETLREAIQQLTEDQQNVLIMRFVERMSHEEVAAMLDKSETAIKSIQHRALLRLTALLGSGDKTRHYLRGRHD